MKTIAAIATAQAAAGIGVVRISGDCAINIADTIFFAASGKALATKSGYTASLGSIYDGGAYIDKAVALVFRAPKSYTGEDVVELSGHGGPLVISRILRAALNAGAKPAEPGEFTRRAFLNGKLGLSEAEAVMGLIAAKGEAARAATLNVLDGALSREVKKIAVSLTGLSAHLAAWADYPEDDLPELSDERLVGTLSDIQRMLNKLLKTFDAGQAVIEGVDTAIVGRPNVGKSTLLNLLAGSEKAIVTAVAGTTRDIVEETVRVGSATLRLADTAGIRESSDEIERIGVERALTRMERAALVIVVLEGSSPLSDGDRALLKNAAQKKCVVAVNKSDLEQKIDENELRGYTKNIVYVCAANGENLSGLTAMIENVLGTADFDTSAPALITERQRRCVSDALEAAEEALSAVGNGMTRDAVGVSIDGALSALFTLTGERASEAVVDEVFRKFCLGK